MRCIGQSPTHGCSFEHEIRLDWTSTHTHDAFRACNFTLASKVRSGNMIEDAEVKVRDDEGIPPLRSS
jgi:hypothetical protein